jgi:hypothetical protein
VIPCSARPAETTAASWTSSSTNRTRISPFSQFVAWTKMRGSPGVAPPNQAIDGPLIRWGECRRASGHGKPSSTWENVVKTTTCVELRGFEPLTPSLRTRCSAELSYSPQWLRDGTSHRESRQTVCRPRRAENACHPGLVDRTWEPRRCSRRNRRLAPFQILAEPLLNDRRCQVGATSFDK